MKLALFAVLFEATALAATCPKSYPVTAKDGLQCRDGPGTNFEKIIKTYPEGARIRITCQTPGTSVDGNDIWIKTQDGCYVADRWVKTGTNGYVAKKCPVSGGGEGGGDGGNDGGNDDGGDSKVPGPVKNDYPYKDQCGPEDKWLYYKCRKSLPCSSQRNRTDGETMGLCTVTYPSLPQIPPHSRTPQLTPPRMHLLRRLAHQRAPRRQVPQPVQGRQLGQRQHVEQRGQGDGRQGQQHAQARVHCADRQGRRRRGPRRLGLGRQGRRGHHRGVQLQEP
jgi:hypothetical protein